MIKFKKKGVLFWITGLSGSGKTTIAKKIYKQIVLKYGPTLLINGDEIRKFFRLRGYSFQEREKIGFSYSKLFKKITDQNINVLFAGVVLNKKIRIWNRKNIKNYLEIYIKSNTKKIIKKKYKSLYRKTNNIVGIKIKAEFPSNPDIIVQNNFDKKVHVISKNLMKKVKDKLDDK